MELENVKCTKGISCSPDGLCVLVGGDDAALYLYEVPPDGEFQNAPVLSNTAGHQVDGTNANGSSDSIANGLNDSIANGSSDSMAIGLADNMANESSSSNSGGEDRCKLNGAVGQKCKKAVLKVNFGGTLYGYQWYPFMDSMKVETCVFISTAQNVPIQMYDAYRGELVASYRGYNHLDENTHANSLMFTADGSKIVGGYDRCIRIFDTSRPGRECDERSLGSRKSKFGQRGIISCLASNDDRSGLFAAGSYDKSIGLYDEREPGALMQLMGHHGGLTQLLFSKDGQYLYSGARKDSFIYRWDIRNTASIINQYERVAGLNQKIEFDVHNERNWIATGSQDQQVLVYDIESGQKVNSIQGLQDAVNGVSFLHRGQGCKIATCTGQRRYFTSDEIELKNAIPKPQAQLWHL